jgi:hypothetical protein
MLWLLPYTYVHTWTRVLHLQVSHHGPEGENDCKRTGPIADLFVTERASQALHITRSMTRMVSLEYICYEYQTLTVSAGPGADTSARVAQDHILTSEQAQSFTLEEVFMGTPAWIDFDYAY